MFRATFNTHLWSLTIIVNHLRIGFLLALMLNCLGCYQSDQYRVPLSVDEKGLLTCSNPDAIATADNECILYACNAPSDVNYKKYAEYREFIKDLPASEKLRYKLYHQAKKCKIEASNHGCTMKGADNYNPYALVDDCTCEFSFCPKKDFSHTSIQASYLKYKHHSQCEKSFEPTNTCGVADDCLCSISGTSKKLNRYDHDRMLVIRDSATLDALEKSDQDGFSVSVGKLFEFLKPNTISFHNFVESYIDGYLLDDNSESTINELIPRHHTAEVINTMWAKTNDNFQVHGAPYRLHAVIYRPDLIKYDSHGKALNAGQGRLIFSLNPSGALKQFKKPSHIIMEYWLPINELTQAEWNLNFAKLKCLEGKSYIDQLRHLIKKFTYSSTENFDAIRVNDFRGRDHDLEEEWALFEFRINQHGFVRVPLPLTPKDNGSEAGGIKGQGQNFSQDLHDQIGEHFIQEFQNIKTPHKSYSLPPHLMAMQNTFEDLAAWGLDLQIFANKNPTFLATTEPAERTYAMYRYSLNTCVGCHSGAFIYHNPARRTSYLPLVTSQEVKDRYGELRFSKITRNNFGVLHIFDKGQISQYLQEDIKYRAQDVETLLSQTYCK